MARVKPALSPATPSTVFGLFNPKIRPIGPSLRRRQTCAAHAKGKKGFGLVCGHPRLLPFLAQLFVDKSKARREFRLKELRNEWWFPDHLVVAPLWRDLKEASRHTSGVLLDVGCGNAPYRPWFAGRTSRYVTADYPPVAAGVDIGCDSSYLPFQPCVFDTILCTQMLEHTPTPWRVSAELHRILRPEGILILTCPQYWPAHEEPHDYFRFTVYGLRSLFPETTWEWLEHRQQGSTWAVISCALWHSFATFGRGKKLAAFLVNPLFSVLDRYWRTRRDTTNHLVVLRKKPDARDSP